MASSDETMERFAHDVCVHVLEKFGIFKAPDDTRKQNKYVSHDFLPRISRSVVSFAIWIRTYFKNAFEDKYKAADFDDNEVIWIFEDQLLESDEFSRLYWVEKVCVSLALCTEYVQFASTKDFRAPLNKLVIGWSEFFKEHLKSYFEENDGFLGLYYYLEISQIGQLGEFQEAFISEYCLPYGTIECTTELAKKCSEKRGLNISLKKTIFGIQTLGYIHEGFSRKLGQVKFRKFAESEEPDSEQTCSDKRESEDSRNTSVDSVMEASPNIDSDSEIPPNKLLGIPPHEDTVGEIDPFFVKNIPSPPKARSFSKSPVHKSGSSKVPGLFSKSPESETGSIKASKFSSKSLEREFGSIVSEFFSKWLERRYGLSDDPNSLLKSHVLESETSATQSRSTSKSPERESGSSEISKSLKSLESEYGQNDAPKSFSKAPECESVPSDAQSRSTLEREFGSIVSEFFSKRLERRYGLNDASNSPLKSPVLESETRDAQSRSTSKTPERESGSSEVSKSSSKSPESEYGQNDAPKSFSKASERDAQSRSFSEREFGPIVSEFFSKLFEHGYGLVDASKSPVLESLPSDAQSRSTSKLSERESGSSEVSKSSSKSPESESGQNDAPKSFSKAPERDAQSRSFSESPERETGARNDLKSSSKSPERESGSNKAPKPSSKPSEGESAVSDACRPSLKSPEGESAPSEILRTSSILSVHESGSNEVTRPSSKSPEGESAQSEIPQASSKSPKHESGPSDAEQSSSKPPEHESVLSHSHLQASPKTEEELKERVGQTLTRLEHEMDELRALLYDYGLVAMKTGRRGTIRLRVQDSKDKQLPPGPEGLI